MGGLNLVAAVARVCERVEAPLHRPATARIDAFEVRSTPWDFGYRLDVAQAVRQTMAGGRGATVAPAGLTPVRLAGVVCHFSVRRVR